ncbi:Orn/DAP/Arg decarboxylase 2, N-terminal [Dillenia turbinata]|uniref:Orn/DAP/Arg decarboxylase 2, N-terminal n=1 Tax=Dillenia turbinata TaxID=194707 RepID=A0AAN8W1Y8_9MAGN
MTLHQEPKTKEDLNSASLKAIVSGSSCVRKSGRSTFLSLPKDDEMLGLIRSIAEKQEVEPFYMLDLGVVERLMVEWNSSLPNIRPYYAVKCNTNPALLTALAALDANFDCASRREIEAVLSLGVSADRIVYANPCKAISHIKYAASVGVNLTTFNTKEEIDKIKKWNPKCALLLRITLKSNNTSFRELGSKSSLCAENTIYGKISTDGLFKTPSNKTLEQLKQRQLKITEHSRHEANMKRSLAGSR